MILIKKLPRQRKKLFFPIGILSLCLLPLLGFTTLFSDKYFDKVRVIELAYIPPSWRSFILADLNNANAPAYAIQGNFHERKNKIENINRQIGVMQKIRPDSFIFHLVLKEEATYADFISVLDICKKRKVRQYAVENEHIWIWAGKYIKHRPVENKIEPFCGNTGRTFRIKPDRPWLCGTGLFKNEYREPTETGPEFKELLLQNPHWPLLILSFVFLLVFNFFSLRRHSVFMNGILPTYQHVVIPSIKT